MCCRRTPATKPKLAAGERRAPGCGTFLPGVLRRVALTGLAHQGRPARGWPSGAAGSSVESSEIRTGQTGGHPYRLPPASMSRGSSARPGLADGIHPALFGIRERTTAAWAAGTTSTSPGPAGATSTRSASGVPSGTEAPRRHRLAGVLGSMMIRGTASPASKAAQTASVHAVGPGAAARLSAASTPKNRRPPGPAPPLVGGRVRSPVVSPFRPRAAARYPASHAAATLHTVA